MSQYEGMHNQEASAWNASTWGLCISLQLIREDVVIRQQAPERCSHLPTHLPTQFPTSSLTLAPHSVPHTFTTQGGGFCGTRTKPLNLDLSAYDGLQMRVKGDGQIFKFNIKTVSKKIVNGLSDTIGCTHVQVGGEVCLVECSFLPYYRRPSHTQLCTLHFTAPPPLLPTHYTTNQIIKADQEDTPESTYQATFDTSPDGTCLCVSVCVCMCM